jgi:hypothetical protein
VIPQALIVLLTMSLPPHVTKVQLVQISPPLTPRIATVRSNHRRHRQTLRRNRRRSCIVITIASRSLRGVKWVDESLRREKKFPVSFSLSLSLCSLTLTAWLMKEKMRNGNHCKVMVVVVALSLLSFIFFAYNTFGWSLWVLLPFYPLSLSCFFRGFTEFSDAENRLFAQIFSNADCKRICWLMMMIIISLELFSYAFLFFSLLLYTFLSFNEALWVW